MDERQILAVVATAMTVAVAGTYTWRAARDPLKAPHVVAWALLAFLGAAVTLVQWQAGAGLGTLVLATATCFNAANCYVGFRKRGSRDVTPSAVACGALSAVAVGLWLATDNPTFAAVLLSTAGVAAFLPTVTRTWASPETEVQGTYWFNTLRYLLATLAVAHYSWTTMLYPATWVAINGGFSIYHMARLRAVRRDAPLLLPSSPATSVHSAS